MPPSLWLLLAGCFLAPGGKDDPDEDVVEVGDDDDGPTGDDDDATAVDQDDDGFTAGEDCDDLDPAVNPEATEVCDPANTDEDCDGKADTADTDVQGGIVAYHDADGDGYGDPTDPATVCEIGGGYVANALDCADGDPLRNPLAVEVCDALDVDEDCDTLADDADPSVNPLGFVDRWIDGDDDTYGDVSDPGCDVLPGWADRAGDCDDADGDVHPAATEVCNDKDDDCVDGIDQGALDATLYWRDADQDGYGNIAIPIESCDPAANLASVAGDCNDAVGNIHPGEPETCDGVDEDCDNAIDNAAIDAPTWYADVDDDGYGDPLTAVDVCDAPADHVLDGTDCDDDHATANPVGVEVCEGTGIDEDCDGLVNDQDPGVQANTRLPFYADDDGDGYGNEDDRRLTCSAPPGYVADDTDCDDLAGAVNPGGTEVCDGADRDEDCDTLADDDDPSLDLASRADWFRDADQDGAGMSAMKMYACDVGAGWVASVVVDDCDDGDPDRSPQFTEVCDPADVDEDCDNVADDADVSVAPGSLKDWFPDGDLDGFGDAVVPVESCEPVAGHVGNAGDCDDAADLVHPGATELCDLVDDDCDGSITCVSGYGDVVTGEVAAAPSGIFGYLPDRSGDLDGDGQPDLVAVSSDGVLIFAPAPTTGVTTLDAAIEVPTDAGGVAHAIVVEDVDADGASDLIFQEWHADDSTTIHLLHGPLGAGTLDAATLATASWDSPAGAFAEDLDVVPDTDGDGVPELLLHGPTHRLLPLDAVGALDAAAAASATLVGALAEGVGADAVAGDLDGDGLADLVIGASFATVGGVQETGTVYVHAGPVVGALDAKLDAALTWKGTDTFEREGSILEAGDYDGDGDLDVLTCGLDVCSAVPGDVGLSGPVRSLQVGTFEGDAGQGVAGLEVVSGDVDGDGIDDVVFGFPGEETFGGALFVVTGPFVGARDMSDVAGWVYRSDLGWGVGVLPDVDGDGYDEIVGSVYARGPVAIFPGASILP